MTQRLTFMALITMSFIGLFIGKACKQKVILILISLLSLFGTAIAGRQIWLQMLPPHLASCGPDFSYLVELFPAKDIAKAMLIGDGNCAEIVWTFLGISIPGLFLFGSLPSFDKYLSSIQKTHLNNELTRIKGCISYFSRVKLFSSLYLRMNTQSIGD